ncbi:MAG: DNA polymerase III subunit alpha, partial [Dokdonella sp.]|nr:DNA polymerase III subunit alpha [Dokdonella sp.]
EVIEYVAAKYGRDRVSQIITYGTMAAKAVVRDVGRVLGMSYGQVDRIAKLIPFELGITLDEALRKEPELKRLYAEDEEITNLIDLARSLEGLTRSAGTHAGGVVIAPSVLTDFAPLYCEEGSQGVVTQFDKDDVEAAGLVKFDFLGLRTLTIIDRAVATINALRAGRGEPPVVVAGLPMGDAATFALLKSCRTTAVFQLESRGMKDLIRRLQPDCFEDIVALVALFRPGPLQSGMVDDFIARKHSPAGTVIDYLHPDLQPALAPTYGVILYQEQVMQIAQVLAGYTLGGADLLRRAMGKKKPEEMAKQRSVFISGATGRGVPAGQAAHIFDLMEKFAGYGFNKSHSAAYALLSYQTAWLKAHYPAAFMAAVLSADMDGTDKVVNFIHESRALALTVTPPHVNASNWMFEAIDARTIRYGLGAVKGVGHAAIDNIVGVREQGGSFRDLADFCARVDPGKVNKRVFDALLLAGALDGLGANRASLAAQLPEAVRAAEQRARDAQSGQFDIFGAALGAVPSALAPPPVTVDEWPLAQRLAGERDTLGHYLSGHPTDAWRELLARVVTCPNGELDKHYKPAQRQGERSRYGDRQAFTLAGSVTGLRKQGDKRAFVQVEDWSGRFEAVLYNETFAEYAPLITRDAILVFEGTLSIDDFSGNYQLRTQRVSPLDSAVERQARVLRLTVNGIGRDFAARLHGMLEAHRGGNTPVRISFSNAQGRGEVELGPDWRVRASPALIEALGTLEGVLDADCLYGINA